MELEVDGQKLEGNTLGATGVARTRQAETTQLAGKRLPQHTLNTEFVRSGVGLHTGLAVQVRVLPAAAGRGRYFTRVDQPGSPEVAAQVAAVRQTTLSTELVQGEAGVRTVEHLLAALAGMGVTNARIEIDGPEVPLLDGSAKDWVDAIAQAGIVAQAEPYTTSTLKEPLWVRDGDAFVAALPSSERRFTYGIDFALPAIGKQWHSWSPDEAGDGTTTFATAIAPARTFGLEHQIEALRDRGLIKGGNLTNALVCGSDGWLNPPLRFLNEPVRHKLLDLIGDLSLLGNFPIAHFLAYKASHHLHVQLARTIAALSC
ncbi:MAG: UDP-3-O-acyl-N-acetylglucosamine deacetylase [Tildeniella nuda ZEHNDER 1965/U140]|jgi:UDP-3-O-[3-hydroxymyristoyl] N-acetylglucosamine deacetylase|nr:UDP-3-O-acyl-N-acetylglucosamine deacetylase [Tildeniella nuda ZEHNDER 1965/U140]